MTVSGINDLIKHQRIIWAHVARGIWRELNQARFVVTVQNQERPLHVAARHGHVRMVEALLDDDANPLLKSTVSVFHVVSTYQ